MMFRRRSRCALKPPARLWFQALDGSFYRNCPLIAAERDQVMAWPLTAPGRLGALDALFAEWSQTFRQGLQRKGALGPGDVLAEPAPFREAYPHYPGLRVLDKDITWTT